MEAAARRKVPGGKLLAVRLEHDGRTVTGAELSGDFFLHPEEFITYLEEALIGVPVTIPEDQLASRIGEAMERRKITAVGFAPRDLSSLAREALD